jgi:hypothetical protein
MKTIKTSQDYLNLAYLNLATCLGSYEVSKGTHLYSQSTIIEEQQSWNEFDESKSFDFTTAEFWVLTNDGKKISVHNSSDLDDIHQHSQAN